MQEYVHEEGLRKIGYELNIVHILRSIRKLEAGLSIVINDNDIIL